ncbi:UvrD-helicase domain-containing protein, partial [bacterium]|nr:UvrD-helicase domain-containing protein [bacterium]
MNARTNNSLPDQTFRDEIIANLDDNFLVEAGAGTGKTTSLVGRMLALLKQGKCAIDALAAITFTRKAAAELRARFQIKLEDELRQCGGAEAQRLSAALQQIEQCFIGTIHSFCGRLLRERPVEAGVHVSFAELDDAADRELRERAWEEYAARLYADDADVLSKLNALGLNIGQLKQTFLTICNYPDVDEWPGGVANLPDVSAFLHELNEYVKHIESIAPEFPKDKGNDKLMDHYLKIARMAKQFDVSAVKNVITLLENCKKVSVIQKQWPQGIKQGKTEKERWEAFCEQCAPLKDALFAHRYHIVFKALQPALAYYEDKKQLLGALNFQDLLMRTAAMLRKNPAVRKYFQNRITHLLVDEFQDTDPIQAEVMMLLTGEDVNETDWRKVRPAPGSLFVVGDPKQSIYRFRRADIQVYNQVKEIIQNLGGRVGALSTNFRTDAPILHWVNKVFSPMFPEQATASSPQYIALQPPETASESEAAPVYSLDIPEECKNKDDILPYEANQIAAWIQSEISSSKRCASDFMIIAYKRRNLSLYAQALQQRGIPHQVTGGGAVSDNKALRWLALCLSCVLQPENPIALVAFLRSGLLGFSDPYLYAFRKDGGAFCYLKHTQKHSERLEAVYSKLRNYAKYFDAMPLAVAVNRIAEDIGLYAWCSVQDDAAHQAGGLAKLIEVVRARQNEWTTARELLSFLLAIENGDEALDGMEVRPPQESGVQIMNLHKVKGLEAPIVILADPTGRKSRKPSICISRDEQSAKGYLLIDEPIPMSFGSRVLAYPQGWDQTVETEQTFLDDEFNRLLYVAATRAKHQMVITKRNKRTSENYWNALAQSAFEWKAGFDANAASLNKPQATVSKPKPIPAFVESWQPLAQPTFAIRHAKEFVHSTYTSTTSAAAKNETALQWGN